MELSDFGKQYLFLGLRINKLIDGYAGSYFGPNDLKHIVDNEQPKSPIELLKSCKYLKEHLSDQGFGEERVKFLKKMLKAMETCLEIKKGIEIPYLEQVKGMYDITPTLIDDS